MWKIAALYRFVEIEDIASLRARLLPFCQEHDVCGTLLLAPEGINGTIAAPPDQIDAVIDCLDQELGVRQGELKFSESEDKPFRRLKIRPKKEIITMRAPEADPTKRVGTYVAPEDWNKIISAPDVITLDTRNTYETKTGIFKGAIDPKIENFTDFKTFVEKHLDPARHKKVAMYCTGGIRCEKASSYMLAKGFEEVYHLKGGILKYLEEMPLESSLWEGECFVFDRRVTVGHALKEGDHTICYNCRTPLSQEETHAEDYEEGVSCPYCLKRLSSARINMLRLRHEQMKDTA